MTLHLMTLHSYRVLGLFLLFSMGRLAAGAQEPLTLRQAINQALGQSPEAAIARAGNLDAKSAASMARAQRLPQLGFTEDISRGNDPVYAFGTRLRQRQFTQADFALNARNIPQPIGDFSTRFSDSG
jgi:outer membrane protein TolC